MNLEDVKALIFQRGWLTLSGVATLLIVPHTLTRSEQGLFFTLISLAAIQSIFEAGITSVFLNHAAHERAALETQPPPSETARVRAESRLRELVVIAHRWFLALALLFLVLVGTFGFSFLDAAVEREGLMLHWQAPFLVLVAAISLSLYNLSRIPILEGYGRIAAVANFRLRASVLSAVSLWIGMAVGWGLWALALSYAIQSVSMTLQITKAYRLLALPSAMALSYDLAPAIQWRTEILPMQSRLAGSYFCGYLIAQAVVPYTLQAHGSETAGQIGLMLSVFSALAVIVASYMYAAAPTYATHVALQQHELLAALFSKVTRVTLIAALAVYTLVLLAVHGLNHFDLDIAPRMAGPRTVLWMVVIGLVNAYVGSVATLLRAEKKEPLLPLSIAVAVGYILAMSTLRDASVESLFMAFAAIQLLIALPCTLIALKRSGLLRSVGMAT